jgi:glycerol uptake facilitator-like aquaporin
MFYSVLILLYFLTQMMDNAHKVNIKCDIQYVYLEVEPAMSSTVQALHNSFIATFITIHSVTMHHQKSYSQYSCHTCAHMKC